MIWAKTRADAENERLEIPSARRFPPRPSSSCTSSLQRDGVPGSPGTGPVLVDDDAVGAVAADRFDDLSPCPFSARPLSPAEYP